MPWFVYGAVLLSNSFALDLETKVLALTLHNTIVNALRNPLIARLAFHVNKQILRQTVEDRRKHEIEEALQKRQERRMKINAQLNNQTQANQNVWMNQLRRHCSLPNVEV